MILYHASDKNNLDVISPKPTLSRDVHIGDYVFATENEILAKMYLANKGLAILMEPDEKQPTIVICSDKESYIKNDIGGTIYELNDESFIESPQKELSSYEKVSTEPVKPITKNKHESSLKAMKEAGIKIYFVDEKTFNNLIGNPKQKEIIKTLESY
jgi:hypothetical protein